MVTSFDACVCLATEVPQNEVLEFEPTGLEKSAETLSLSFHVSRAVLHPFVDKVKYDRFRQPKMTKLPDPHSLMRAMRRKATTEHRIT